MRFTHFFLNALLGLFSIAYSQSPEDVYKKLSNQEKQAIQKEMDSIYEYAQKFFYTHLDSTQYYGKKIYDLATHIGDLNTQLGILNQLIISDNYAFDLKMVYKDVNTMDSLIKNDKRIDTLTDGLAYNKFLLSSKGNYYFKLGNLNKAKTYFHKLLKELNKSGDSLDYFDAATRLSTLEFLGETAKKQNKLSLAVQYYDQVRRELEYYKYRYWKNQLMGVNNKVSRILISKGEFQKASTYLQQSLLHFKEEAKENTKLKNLLKSSYQVTIENYLKQDSTDLALLYIKESRDLIDDNDPFKKQLDLLAGDAWLKKLDFKKAEFSYKQGLKEYQKYRDNKKHADIAGILLRFSNLEVQREELKAALVYCQRALDQLSSSFDVNSIGSNPNTDKASSKLTLIQVLTSKLTLLKKLYLSEKNIEYLYAALKTSQAFISSFDALKPEYENKVDKQFLINEMYPALQDAVAVCYQLFDITNNKKYVEQAFYFIEKSKSILLLEAIRNAQANSFGGVPDDILNKEQQYKASILHLEKKTFIKNNKRELSDTLFKLRTEYYDFISKLEKDYPRYYNLKYDNKVVRIDEVLNFIDDGFTILNYFMGDDAVYLVQIQKGELYFDRIDLNDHLKSDIQKFYTGLSNVQLGSEKMLAKISYTIFDKLLRPSLDRSTSKNIIVIPDDILYYLPIDALATKSNGSDYILNKYVISYGNSATLWCQKRIREDSESGDLLAFAPQFDRLSATEVMSDRSQFAPLKYNQVEVEKISTYFDTKSLIGSEATMRNLNQLGSGYRILHFATHASANDEYPDYSYLALVSDRHQDSINFLYVQDLYAKNLNAELVTLSACETGIGKFQKGEGILSLARGFKYAGAKALLTSLWRVNDDATSQIMNLFYKNLKKGQLKNEALRNAKMEYLDTTDDSLLKHPYYWAGFALSGDVQPLEMFSIPWVLWVCGILLLILSFGVYKKIT